MAGIHVLSDNELKANIMYNTLMRQTSVAKLKVEIDKTFWPNAENYETIPARVTGLIGRWVKKTDATTLWTPPPRFSGEGLLK